MTNYLKWLNLKFDLSGSLEETTKLSPLERKENYNQYVGSISKVVSASSALMIFLESALRISKIEMLAPPTSDVWLTLTRQPRHKFEYSKRHKLIQIDREYDPNLLLNIPYDTRSLGEFSIGCWEWALPYLALETDFPVNFVQQQLDRFRKEDYSIRNQMGESKISGSKAKARIYGSVSCAQTILNVAVSFRGEILFEREIWHNPQPAFTIAYTKREFAVENGCFKVLGARKVLDKYLLPEASFPLDGLPDSFLRTLT